MPATSSTRNSAALGRCADAVAPALKLGPHVAPLGLRFYDGRQFPAAWRGSLFIAEHGSWNRSQKIGYRVMRVRMNGARPASYEEFVSGWLRPDGTVTGRPVDLLVLADGSMLLSDDVAGVVYRITYRSADLSRRRTFRACILRCPAARPRRAAQDPAPAAAAADLRLRGRCAAHQHPAPARKGRARDPARGRSGRAARRRPASTARSPRRAASARTRRCCAT